MNFFQNETVSEKYIFCFHEFSIEKTVYSLNPPPPPRPNPSPRPPSFWNRGLKSPLGADSLAPYAAGLAGAAMAAFL